MKNCFYIKNFCYLKDENEIDVSFMPPLTRRKLSLLDKTTLALANKIFNESIEEIVFASEYGEFTRLDTIISQYQEMNEVSPAQFSASVHNYPVSFFTLYKKLNIPYHAISSGEKSLAAGLVKSIISKKETLFIYADVKNGVQGAACVISPESGIFKAEYNTEISEINYGFSGFIEFLDGQSKNFSSAFGTFTRAS